MKKMWYHHYHLASFTVDDGNWTIGNPRDIHYLFMEDILHFLDEKNLKTIPLNEIAWKGKHKFPLAWTGERYENSDTSYPGILVSNAPNPFDNKYRMVDGRRRIHKLLANKVKESLYYVIDYKELKPYFLCKSDPIVKKRLQID